MNEARFGGLRSEGVRILGIGDFVFVFQGLPVPCTASKNKSALDRV